MPRSTWRANGPAAGLVRAAAVVLGLVLATAAAANSVAAPVRPAWHLPERPVPREFRQDGIVIKVTALLVEPVMGFLIGRGFPASVARRYAASCVIRVVMSNESAPAVISYDLRSWRLRRPDGTLQTPLTREYWTSEWQASALSKTSRIGFEWSQLPTRQELEDGDSTQGLVNTGLPPGTRFDLLLEWVVAGRAYRNKLEGIDCAPAP